MDLSGFSSKVNLKELPGNKISIYIQKVYCNMQTDYACFEAIALILKIREKCNEIRLGFQEINWDGDFKNFDSDQPSYMRFLYRLYHFQKAFDWFKLEDKEQSIVNQFVNKLKSCNLVCNKPGKMPGYNPNKGIEHQIENSFADPTKKRDYFIDQIKQKTGKQLICVYNQLPNGLFYDKVSEQTRIFPTGYFDLWGITDTNELCIFELKDNKNLKMGIISELFFYSVFTKEFLVDSHCFAKTKQYYRGFDVLLNALNNGCNKVNAYFLTDGLHSLIRNQKNEICEYLNSFEPGITFDFISYKQSEVIL